MNAPLPRYRTGDDELDLAIVDLLGAAGLDVSDHLLFEMATSVLRMGRENVTRLDLKIVSASLKELRYAFEVFAPYRGVRKASVFGSACTPPGDPAYEAAVALGSALRDAGWMVITGGGPGIMSAATRGSGGDNSFAVSIKLPFESSDVDSLLPPGRLVNFRYFFNRKLTFMKESSGYVLFPGGFGTLDEAFELLTLLQTGRAVPSPVVLFEPPGDAYWRSFRHFLEVELADPALVGPDDMDMFTITSDVEEAVEVLASFYRRYHSLRYVGERLVVRLREPVSDGTLEDLNSNYADLVSAGTIERCEASAAERSDDDVVDLPRLCFRFVKTDYARLHAFIRALNSAT